MKAQEGKQKSITITIKNILNLQFRQTISARPTKADIFQMGIHWQQS